VLAELVTLRRGVDAREAFFRAVDEAVSAADGIEEPVELQGCGPGIHDGETLPRRP
jgi:hypothetical protein